MNIRRSKHVAAHSHLRPQGHTRTGRLRALLRHGGVINIAIAVVAAGTVVTATAIMTSPSSWMRTSYYRPSDPLSNQELAVALTRVGLDAQTLAAAGMSSAQVTAVVSDARTHLADHIQSLRDADASVGSTAKDRDRLRRLVESGQASPEDVQSLATAQTAVASAVITRQEVLDAVFSAATASLPAQTVAAITTVQANRSAGWDMPTQYLAIDSYTQQNWVNLRDALDAERIAAGYGQEPDPDAHTLVTTADGLSAVATASTNLGAKLADDTAAWNTAVSGH